MSFKLTKYLKNSSWMLAEQILKIIVGIFVGILVAKHLGVESFGTFSYIVVIVFIIQSIARMGFDNILVREIARTSDPDAQDSLLATSMIIMFVTNLIGIFFLIIYAFIFEDNFHRNLIFIAALSGLFQASLTIDYWFQGQVKSKFSSIAKSAALFMSGSIKLTLIYYDAELLIFIIAFVFDHILVSTFLLFTRYQFKPIYLYSKYDSSLVKRLLKGAIPLMLSALAFSLYAKVDQIMIQKLIGSYDLGIYAAAARIFDGMLILPYVLIMSLIPAIIKFKENNNQIDYLKKVSLIYRYMFIAMLFFSIIIASFSEELIRYTFGSEFIESAEVLSILVWATLITTIGTVSARILMIEKLEKKILKMTVSGLLINIALNLYWIPEYGIKGAAYSTIISMFVAFVIIDYFDRDLVFLRQVKLRAFFGTPLP